MKKIILGALFASSFLLASNQTLTQGVSDLGVQETSVKLQKFLESKKINIFSVIEHSNEAKKANLEMQDTQVVIFGAPKVGTPLMVCSPKIALELPLKILIYKDKSGKTIVAYEDMKSVSKRYDTKDCQEIIERLSMAQKKIFEVITTK